MLTFFNEIDILFKLLIIAQGNGFPELLVCFHLGQAVLNAEFRFRAGF